MQSDINQGAWKNSEFDSDFDWDIGRGITPVSPTGQ